MELINFLVFRGIMNLLKQLLDSFKVRLVKEGTDHVGSYNAQIISQAQIFSYLLSN